MDDLTKLYHEGDARRPIAPRLDMNLGRFSTMKPIRQWVKYVLFYHVSPEGTKSPKGYKDDGSNAKRLALSCSGQCGWCVVVSKNVGGEWIVGKCVDRHGDMCLVTQVKLTPQDIKNVAFDKVIANSTADIHELDEVARNAGMYQTSTTKLYRANRLLVDSAKDPFIDGFNLLKSYLPILCEQNPRSVVQLQVEVDSVGLERFGRLFVMLGATVEVVIAACKPVLSIDGAFTKVMEWNKYNFLLAGQRPSSL